MNNDGLQVTACVFDAYGTIFDFASAAAECRDVLGDRTVHLTSLWRDKQLQYTWLRGLQGRHADFWQVTTDALDFTMESLGIDDGQLRGRLLESYRRLHCFPEVPAVLAELKRRGFITAILSNGTPGMLAEAIESARLTNLFDHVLSVEQVGIFKPHPGVYQLAVDKLGVAAHQIAFQSSNAWDAHAASAFGMRAVWCNRYGHGRERLPGMPEREIQNLADLPPLVVASN